MTVRRLLIGLGTLLLAAVLWTLAGMAQVYAASGDLEVAGEHVEALRAVGLDSDLDAATADLADAAVAFESARRRTSGFLAAPVRLLPVIGDDIEVVANLSAAGVSACQAGTVLVDSLTGLPGGLAALAPANGRLPLAVYQGLVAPLQYADALMGRALRHVEQTQDVPVYPDVASARDEFGETLRKVSDALHRNAVLAEALPAFLGADEPRRYLFVAQNPAETRGTGGFIGAYAVMTADNGRLSFGQFDQIQRLTAYHASEVVPPTEEFGRLYNRYGGAGFWHNINMTPDFPTASRAMLALYAKGQGEQLDGVVAVDPFAFRALLEFTGPVRVPGFGSVGADEVVDVISNRAHAEIANSGVRKRVLGAVAIGAFEGLLRGGAGADPLTAVGALAGAAGDGHILLRAEDPDVQAAFIRSGVAGQLLDSDGDFLAVVANAGSAAKLDYYLQRTIAYEVDLHPDGTATGRTIVTVDNQAPASGVSRRVIGPNAPGLQAGEQRLILSLYGAEDTVATVFSRTSGTRPLERYAELGHSVYRTVAEIPAGDSQTLTMAWRRSQGWDAVGTEGRYRLTVQGQTTLRPTTVEISVTLPEGAVLTSVPDDLAVHADGRLTYRGELSRVLSLDVAFDHDEGLLTAPSAMGE